VTLAGRQLSLNFTVQAVIDKSGAYIFAGQFLLSDTWQAAAGQ